jgi:hypothetical protein
MNSPFRTCNIANHLFCGEMLLHLSPRMALLFNLFWLASNSGKLIKKGCNESQYKETIPKNNRENSPNDPKQHPDGSE